MTSNISKMFIYLNIVDGGRGGREGEREKGEGGKGGIFIVNIF